MQRLTTVLTQGVNVDSTSDEDELWEKIWSEKTTRDGTRRPAVRQQHQRIKKKKKSAVLCVCVGRFVLNYGPAEHRVEELQECGGLQ